MPSKHKHPPLSYRPPEAERLWLLERAQRTGEPVNAILTAAVRALMAAEAAGPPASR